MFSEEEFYIVNREERHFGFLLFSSIIYDNVFREYFFSLINNCKCINNINFFDSGNFDIYSEVTLFRDYWYDLANSKNHTKEFFLQRSSKIIMKFFECFDIDGSIIDKDDMFWTDKKRKKLRFPGKWGEESINLLQNKEKIIDNRLMKISWACNAKPDLLIIQKKSALLIELKLESAIAKKKSGYDQLKTQKDIINLAKLTIPYFSNLDFRQITLAKQDGDIGWDNIKDKFHNELVTKYMSKIIK